MRRSTMLVGGAILATAAGIAALSARDSDLESRVGEPPASVAEAPSQRAPAVLPEEWMYRSGEAVTALERMREQDPYAGRTPYEKSLMKRWGGNVPGGSGLEGDPLRSIDLKPTSTIRITEHGNHDYLTKNAREIVEKDSTGWAYRAIDENGDLVFAQYGGEFNLGFWYDSKEVKGLDLIATTEAPKGFEKAYEARDGSVVAKYGSQYFHFDEEGKLLNVGSELDASVETVEEMTRKTGSIEFLKGKGMLAEKDGGLYLAVK